MLFLALAYSKHLNNYYINAQTLAQFIKNQLLNMNEGKKDYKFNFYTLLNLINTLGSFYINLDTSNLKGTIPLNTINYNIDYSHKQIVKSSGTSSDFGIKALDYTRLNVQQIQATFNVLVKTLKKTGIIYVNVCADTPISKKPNGVRMGGGKGETDKWIYKVRPGKILFEISNVSKDKAYIALKQASAKLPIKTKIVYLKKY
ncbi:hypothetical protein WA158_002651 [Blastocystis sp. Blastoise]